MTTITALPPPPDPDDSLLTFNAKAFAFWAAMPNFRSEINTLAGELNTASANASASAALATTKAAEAAASQLAALANAQDAATSAGAIAWVSGTTYAVGDRRWSPANGRVYRRATVGAGTTDPSADAVNWEPIPSAGLKLVLEAGTSATVAANTDTAFTNPAAWAATVPAIAIGDSVVIRGDNGLKTNTVDLGARSMVGPNGVIRSGVITLDTEPLLALRWWGDYYRRA